MMKNADGKKLWQKLEKSGVADPNYDQYDEGLMKLCAETTQKLEAEENSFKAGAGKYAGKRGNSAPIYNATRERAYADLVAEMQKRYPKTFCDAFWTEQATSSPTLKHSSSIAEFEDFLAGILDAANVLYTSWAEAIRELGPAERVQYTADTQAELATLERRFATGQAQLIATHPELQPKVYETSRAFVSIIRGHKLAYADDTPVHTVMECWDEACPADDESYEIPDLTTAEVRAKMLGNVSVAKAFDAEKPVVTQDTPHADMNASRVAASMLLYCTAAKRARAIVEANPSARPVILDIGAGAFGCERLTLLKQDARNKDICVHAMVPIVDAADEERLRKLRNQPTFMTWNDTSVTRTTSTTRLNWCRHKARDCYCMGLYTHVIALAVHSAYYFTQADFENVFKHANTIDSLEHIPDPGRTIPMDKPEFEWVDATADRAMGMFKRWGNKVREAVTWTKQVEMRPLTTGGTTYRHPDNGERLRNGGFHPNVWSRTVDNVLESDTKLAAFAAGVAAAGAIGGLVGAIGQSTACSVVAACKGAVSSLALTTAAAAFVKWDAKQETPWLPGEYTVEARIASSYANARQEQLCHLVRYAKLTRGTQLDRQVVESVLPAVEEVGRVAAALTTAADTPRTERMMAAVLLRDGIPARVAKSTLQQARRIADFLFPAPATHVKPPWLLRGAWAVACLPFVSGSSQALSSALAASFCPAKWHAPAKVTLWLWSTNPMTVIYLALSCPMHLAGIWLVLYLLDRMHSG